jgi:GT2 family glycosyltransferase
MMTDVAPGALPSRKTRAGDGRVEALKTVSASSFIICTRNRPGELWRCLGTLLQQTVLPNEVVIVDASDESHEEALRKLLENHPIKLVYVRTPAGRTRQLNAGVRVSSGDPVFFVDDDVELDPRFHEELLCAFEREGPTLGGVQGRIIDDTLLPLPRRAFRALFMLSRHTKDSPGRLLPSGYYTTPARPTQTREVRALRLCGLGFRRKVFDDFSFDEGLGPGGYALKEDVDFSYRVSRLYKLIVVPNAAFRHHKTPTARIPIRDKSRMHVVNNYLFFRKNLEGTPLQRLAFSWALLGRLIAECVRTVSRRNPDYMRGTLEGLWCMLRHKD